MTAESTKPVEPVVSSDSRGNPSVESPVESPVDSPVESPTARDQRDRSEGAFSALPSLRRGFTVALIGADGAGKTTVARRLAEQDSRLSYIYMGSNLEACNWMLPTTWAIRQLRRWRGRQHEGGGPPHRGVSKPTKAWKRPLRWLKSTVLMANRIAEQGFRHAVAWLLRRRKRIVIFDRHFYTDYYAFDIDQHASGQRSLIQRFHGFVLQRVFSKPELVIFLDAPSEVLFARKGEGTVELLEHRRQDYLKVKGEFRHFRTVDVRQSVDQVTEEVIQHLVDFIQASH